MADARQKQDLRLRGPANSKHDLAETEQDLEALLRRIVCGTLPPSSAHGNGVWRRRFRSGPEYTLAEVPAPKLEAKIRLRIQRTSEARCRWRMFRVRFLAFLAAKLLVRLLGTIRIRRRRAGEMSLQN